MIRSEPSGLRGLIEIPELARICFGWRAFRKSITARASSVPDSNSMPAYRSSVFSRTMTMSTLSYRDRTPG